MNATRNAVLNRPAWRAMKYATGYPISKHPIDASVTYASVRRNACW